jgi:uncharacterized protein
VRPRSVVLLIEVAAASAAVVLDLAIPTFVLLAMMGLSLWLRHDGFRSLGLRPVATPHLIRTMFVFAAVWSLVQLSLVMPAANHLSGAQTDLSDFDDLEGNVGLLLGLLALSWTLAAVGEELAYRGYMQTRMHELFGPSRGGAALAVLASSMLFGMAHSEQGLIGVLAITLDAIAFSMVRMRYGTLWAPVLAHGFNNTLGFVAFFFVGPIHGFW